jgi:hypothetical protein
MLGLEISLLCLRMAWLANDWAMGVDSVLSLLFACSTVYVQAEMGNFSEAWSCGSFGVTGF